MESYADYVTEKLAEIKEVIEDKFSATGSGNIGSEPNSRVEAMEQIVDVLDSLKESGKSIVNGSYPNDTVEALDRIKQAIDNMEVSGGGSSDFSTAEVTVNISSNGALFNVAYVLEQGGMKAVFPNIQNSGTYNVIISGNGSYGFNIFSEIFRIDSVSGNIEKLDDDLVLITGSGTINIVNI